MAEKNVTMKPLLCANTQSGRMGPDRAEAFAHLVRLAMKSHLLVPRRI